LDLKASEDGISVRVRVKPRASKTRIVGARDGELEVSVAAPPVDGAANEELCRFLAQTLKVGRSSVTIKSGVTGRHKLVSIRGVTAEQIAKLASVF
jgi:hypothetical protein